LRDEDGQLTSTYHRVAVFELAGIVDIDENTRQFLDHVLASHSRMATGSRCNDVDTASGAEFFHSNRHVFKANGGLVKKNARLDRIAQRLRLLEDLFDHVVGKLTLLSHHSLEPRNRT
jgi:hypothetical protein